MPFSTPSPRTRAALVALAVLLPAFSLASLAGAAWWVRAHGGVAGSLTALVREAAFLAGRVGGAPVAIARGDLAAAEAFSPKAAGTWLLASGDAGRSLSFALVEPGEGGGFSIVMDANGDSPGLATLRRSASGPALWFERDGVEYVVTDPATVERARELCSALRESGREMGRLGAKQGAIGARLGAYGGRLGALGGRLGAASARLATARASASERDRIEAEMDEVRAEMEKVRAEMEAASGEDGEHGALSREMKELSKRHREELAKVRAGLRDLVDEAVRSGKADRLGRST